MSLFNVYPQYDITPKSAKGVMVYDDKGNEYLDMYGGHAVISIGHAHPIYLKNMHSQLDALLYYSNAVKNPLQERLASRIQEMSNVPYQLFLCNSGAEANENALKMASFYTDKKKIVAFKQGFHGRTSAAVAVTDNDSIQASINKQHKVELLPFGDSNALESALQDKEVAAVIFETIQGIGGLEEASSSFYKTLETLCKAKNIILIADEIQSGYGRTGDFFAFQKHKITPDIITIAKGMGNGMPIGGVLLSPKFKGSMGLLGTTFGGNHLACTAALSVLDVMSDESLLNHVKKMEQYFKSLKLPKSVKRVKGRGLMLGLEFDFEVSELRKKLVYDKRVFTGSSSQKNLIRLLPPFNIQKEHLNIFVDKLNHCI